VEPWHSLCPNCGENVWVGVGMQYPDYTNHCNICDTIWTTTDLEIYELSHPDQITIDIVNKLMQLSFEMAMEGKQ
jgi:hypothetical protein